MQKQILTEGHSGYIVKEELETLLRRTFGKLDFKVMVSLAKETYSAVHGS